MNMSELWKSWVVGEEVIGKYCGVNFKGKITEDTRPTPDYKNTILHIKLDEAIEIFGTRRESITIWTNGTDLVYPKRMMERIA